ncbi:MAG: iron-containing redox enzyme family protein [Proteobacteria bacterium]|nr:iron-containing redox enzyme family protein [Pseudomonadota bacterium]
MTPVIDSQASGPGTPPRAAFTDALTRAALERLELQITRSYAHNSLLYSTLENLADVETITHFMHWDGAQPPFARYLRLWLPRAPDCIRRELGDHINIEENQRHSELFTEMLRHLDSLVSSETDLDQDRLAELNYTFSERCAEERDIGFFLGGFWATEIMSAKRCLQIYRGLRRNRVADGPLEYFRIHFDSDEAHSRVVRDRMIVPVLQRTPYLLGAIRHGVHDRLSRSGAYVMWYEMTRLPSLVEESS